MPYYCSDKNKDCYFRLEKKDPKDQGTYTTQKECIKTNNKCKPYKCKGKDNTCVQDEDGVYHSKDACDITCGLNDKTLCSKLQPYSFSYLGIDLNCKDKSQQNLNIVFLIVIIWIGILLF